MEKFKGTSTYEDIKAYLGGGEGGGSVGDFHPQRIFLRLQIYNHIYNSVLI